jgi:hypothetical protein
MFCKVIGSSLTVAMRRGRIDADFRRAALGDLGLLDITTHQHTDSHARSETLNVADRFRLAAYDAPSNSRSDAAFRLPPWTTN